MPSHCPKASFSAALLLLVSQETGVRWCIIGALSPDCIVIKIAQFWFVVYLKSAPHPLVFRTLFTGNSVKTETLIFSVQLFFVCLFTDFKDVLFFSRGF